MCKEAKVLIMMSAIFTAAMGLSGVFVNIFFWRETESLTVIVLYNLMHYIMTPITFIIAGWLSKKKNGIWSLRIGLVLFAIFFGLILLIGSRGVYYIYPLGILFGTASGFYWLAFNTLCFDFTSTDNRDTFNGYNGSCAGIAGVIAPITAAYIISRFSGIKGYNIVFSITLILFILLVTISLFLRCDNYGSRLNISKSIGKNCEGWSNIRKAMFLWGFRDVIIVFIVNILIIQTTGSELSIGKLSLLGALISSGAFVLVQRIVKPPKRIGAVYTGAILSFAAIWGLVIQVNFTTILLYIILDAFFLPFFIIQMSSTTFNVINRAHEEDMRIEYMINKDWVLNGGRIISSLILIAMLKLFGGSGMLRYYLIIIGAAPILSAYFIAQLRDVLTGAKDIKS